MPIKQAMMKLYKKSDAKHIDMHEYRRNNMIRNYERSLDIQKREISMFVVKKYWTKLILIYLKHLTGVSQTGLFNRIQYSDNIILTFIKNTR